MEQFVKNSLKLIEWIDFDAVDQDALHYISKMIIKNHTFVKEYKENSKF